MKKILALLLVVTMVACLFAGCKDSNGGADASSTPNESTPVTDGNKDSEPVDTTPTTTEKMALVTDVGDIDDESFNQTCWEATKAYGDANGIEYQYYKPTEDTDDARLMSIAQAVEEGATVIVLPGYKFGPAIGQAQDLYTDVKFIAVDVAEGDLGGVALKSNVHSIVFHEEQSGYLAGYAAVKEGYTKLGYLGGTAVPAVQRFGYGYIQGVAAAAKEMNVKVELKYTYGGQFYGDANITAKMEGWYEAGTEIVFACGGGIYTSVVQAANNHNGKVIGVDVDQSYIDPCIITSATKGLYNATTLALQDYFGGKWDSIGGTIANLSLTEGDYVGLPTETWSMKNFTLEQYEDLVQQMKDGKVVVNADIEAMPTVDEAVVDLQVIQ